MFANVTTIVGLRPYSAKSNILPEQTLGRGLRKMYPGNIEEYVSVIGTSAFMEFVESIQVEGVEFERREMGFGTKPKTKLVIEVDTEKDIDTLDIKIPIMTPRIYREYKNLADLNITDISHQKVVYLEFSKEEHRKIVFQDITTGKAAHTTVLDTAGVADYRSTIRYFAQVIMKELRLVSGHDVLYGKVKGFVKEELFDRPIELDNPNTLRNLSELSVTKALIEGFKKAINALTVQDKGTAEIRDFIKLREMRPFRVEDQEYVIPQKSIFNKIVGDSHLELRFAKFLEACPEVASYARNYRAVHFNLDYINASGNISHYYPDFIVKLGDGRIFLVETKGAENLDVQPKIERLKRWCEDINHMQSSTEFDFVYVDQESFETFSPHTFKQLISGFREYKDESKGAAHGTAITTVRRRLDGVATEATSLICSLY